MLKGDGDDELADDGDNDVMGEHSKTSIGF